MVYACGRLRVLFEDRQSIAALNLQLPAEEDRRRLGQRDYYPHPGSTALIGETKDLEGG